ncbi:helix-turn-helix domain-containing protein [Nonomuraea maheshkhaliensis]|uniref:helix-turn-helix domain-containing protein n=1 Tax=Nonomuraea maheshkhaliensis TaxID=419590 RepID=UPI003D15D115
MKISEEARRNGVAASPAPADRQGYRVELAPTGEQRARLAQHAGLSRVVEKLLPGEGEGRAGAA